MSFLKWFGWGILWALLLPFLLIGIALIAVFGIPVFFVELIIMIVHFFKGESCFPLYEEDKKAMGILQNALDAQRAKDAGIAPSAPQTQTVYVQQNYYVQPPQAQGTLPPQSQALPLQEQQPAYIEEHPSSPEEPARIQEIRDDEFDFSKAPSAPRKPELLQFPDADELGGDE